MESEEAKKQREIREHLDAALVLLREQSTTTTGLRSRAAKIAVTQLEIASMCAVRSFFADGEYSPLTMLKPADQ